MKIVKTLKEMNEFKTNGGGIIPFTKHNGKYLFLLGRETLDIEWIESGYWADFGGKINNDETNLDGLIREFYEESHGLFGNPEFIKKFILQNINHLLIIYCELYNGYIIFLPIEYDELLPKYFRNIIDITKVILKEDGVKNARREGYLEKDEIHFFSLEELKDGKIRTSLKNIFDFLCDNMDKTIDKINL